MLDLAVTNYEGETHALYRNRGAGVFSDQRFVSGLAEPTLRQLAFGIVAADLDHDGDLDLAASQRPRARERRRVQPPERLSPAQPGLRQSSPGERGARFREVADPGFSHVGASRGLASGDLDRDGDLDLVFTNVADEVEVYENLRIGPGERPPPEDWAAWLQVDLVRSAGNRFGVGARIEVEAGGRRQVREVTAGSSYLSQSALTAHFGLGSATAVDRLTVRWPEGRVQVIEGLPVNRRLRLVAEGSAGPAG